MNQKWSNRFSSLRLKNKTNKQKKNQTKYPPTYPKTFKQQQIFLKKSVH